jgi:RNA polymerase sigma-70 factor (ECF subfamily)
MTDPDEFVALTSAFRPELLAHCYRMIGSWHDAEDLLQETMLRAWRSFGIYQQRASVRTWLYRIATNVCLNALARGPRRRVLPAGIGPATSDSGQPLELAGPQIHWLEPIPDRLVTGPRDPAELAVTRESIRLAFIAALQHLSPRQRAILLLRDVLDWPAREVAVLLETSVSAVNAALLRARHAVEAVRGDESELDDPDDPAVAALVDRYVAAFEDADMAALAELLHADVQVQMPPHATWFAGRDAVVGFFAARVTAPGQVRIVRTRVNGQPALATYLRHASAGYAANSIHLVRSAAGTIRTIVAFLDPAFLRPEGL